MQQEISFIQPRGFVLRLEATCKEDVSLLRAFAEFAKIGRLNVGIVKKAGKDSFCFELSAKPIIAKEKKARK